MFKKFALILILSYQYLISPLKAPSCRFYPTCSTYARQAVEKYGFVRGVLMTIGRIGRCHPWHPGGYDPVR